MFARIIVAITGSILAVHSHNSESSRILVVEDEPSTARSVALFLRHYSFSVAQANSLAQAMSLLAGAEKPTLFQHILLDLNLVDGPGERLLEHLSHNGSPAKVCVLTAVTDRDRLKKLAIYKPHRVMIKPVDMLDLLGWLAPAPSDEPKAEVIPQLVL